MEMTHEGMDLFSQSPRNRKPAMPPRTPGVGQEAEGVRGKCGHEPLLQFPWEGSGEVGYAP